jgi:hypothetical protein
LNREKAAARNAKRREAQKAKDAIVRAELEAAIEANAAALATKPHPLAWRAAKGDTMLDWARWTLSNGGGRAWRETLEAIAAL